MLRRWYVEDKGDTNAYQWEENESVVEWMEKQKNNNESTVIRNINAVRKDAIISQIQRSLEVKLSYFCLKIRTKNLHLNLLFRNVPRWHSMQSSDYVKLFYPRKEEKSFER